jgi:hypothetical protein
MHYQLIPVVPRLVEISFFLSLQFLKIELLLYFIPHFFEACRANFVSLEALPWLFFTICIFSITKLRVSSATNLVIFGWTSKTFSLFPITPVP